jgi:hypothetical protein
LKIQILTISASSVVAEPAPRGSIPGTGECHTQIPIDTEIPEAGEVTADHPGGFGGEVTNIDKLWRNWSQK